MVQTTAKGTLFIEVMLLMSWSIWKMRNNDNRVFEEGDPTIEASRAIFGKEFALVIHRVKEGICSEKS
jgi:hypothetical protein